MCLPYKTKFLLSCFAILLSLCLHAQPYYFRHYQVENGLSNNASICCTQDERGFIWIGTKDGLNRFDGYSFKTFRNNPADSNSLGNNFIRCLYVDKHGVLWVGTEKGLYAYNEKLERFRLLPPTANQPVADIKMDADGNLWYIQLFTLYKYDPAKNRITVYPIGNHFEASSICISSSGDLWTASPTGFIYQHNREKNRFTGYDVFEKNELTSARWIERIYSGRNGKILIGTSNGAKIFDIATHQYKNILKHSPNKTEIFVRNFLDYDSANIWIASESGIYIYNEPTGDVHHLSKAYNDPYSISDNAVYAFCKDKEGGIWAGTYFGGVNYIANQLTVFKKFFPKTGENSLSGNVVREIHEDAKGNLWIGTEDAGLNKYDPASNRFTIYKPNGSSSGIAYTNIHGMLVDGDKLWVGTFVHGLDLMDIGSGKVIRHYNSGSGQLNSNFIFCITKSNEGDIWIGTTGGAFAYNKAQDNFSVLEGMPLYNWYSHLLHDTKNILWGATYGNGIYFYNRTTQQAGHFNYNASDSNSIASDRVNSIFEASDGVLWFATEIGLCKYNAAKRNFTTYNTKQGFPSDFILSILEDDAKHLWVSTSRGIVSFDPATEQVVTYSLNNGILNDQFNFNSAYKDKQGRMYFGSVKGMISFNPAEFRDNNYVPPVLITGFQVFNKEVSIATPGYSLSRSITYTDKIKLDYDQNNISIDFAALSYSAPEMNEYAYQLEGIEKNWTYLKRNRKAYFTDLAPGNYLFKVKAANSSGLWNKQEATLLIEVLPPWWKSTMAYAAYIILFLLILFYSVYLYHKSTEAKNRRKYELLEIAKEKEIFAAKIDFFTNVAHEIKTPLSLIKAPLEKVMKKAVAMPELSNNLAIMDRNTNRLIELTNQLLDFRQTEIKGFGLNFVSANIGELLADTYNSFKPLAEEKNLSFRLSLPATIVTAFIDLDAFNKILYNLFSNAVKYAGKKVEVTLHKIDSSSNSFAIEIKNDGYKIPTEMNEKIFEPFYRMKATEKLRGTGIGLALSRSLVQLHNGLLYMADTDAEMNTFVLKLPVHQEIEFTLTSIPAKTAS
jgi:ligand-binding sensor domain-containing protein/signal transduction histidine kinase